MRIPVWIDGDGDGRVCVYGLTRKAHIAKHEVISGNDAEWIALREALNLIATTEQKHSEFLIMSDSQLVVNQFNNQWKINKKHLQKHYTECWALVQDNDLDIELKWIKGTDSKASKYLKRHPHEAT